MKSRNYIPLTNLFFLAVLIRLWIYWSGLLLLPLLLLFQPLVIPELIHIISFSTLCLVLWWSVSRFLAWYTSLHHLAMFYRACTLKVFPITRESTLRIKTIVHLHFERGRLGGRALNEFDFVMIAVPVFTQRANSMTILWLLSIQRVKSPWSLLLRAKNKHLLGMIGYRTWLVLIC